MRLPPNSFVVLLGSSSSSGPVSESIAFALSTETDPLTTGVVLTIPYWPHANTFLSLFIAATLAPTGASIVVDVKENGTTILSTKPAIEVNENSSVTGTQAVISDSAIAQGSVVTFHIDQVGSLVAGAGLKIFIEATRL